MRALIMIGLVVGGEAAAAEPVSCVVAVEAIGLSPKQVAETRKRLHSEAEAMAANLSFFETASQPDRTCFDEHACVRNAALALTVDGVLHIHMVRVGGSVQLVGRSHRASTGEELGGATLDASAAGFPRSAELRPFLEAMLAGLGAVETTEPLDETTEPVGETTEPVETVPGAALDAVVQPAPPAADLTAALPPAAAVPLTAIVVTASGAALLIAGSVMAAAQEPILNDGTTTGPAKERAHTVGRIGWGTMGAGTVVMASGVVMLALDLLEVEW